jgi:hypothetical protein
MRMVKKMGISSHLAGGVKGGGMCGQFTRATGEDCRGFSYKSGLEQLMGCPGQQTTWSREDARLRPKRTRGVGRISGGARRDAEVRSDAATEVGDGHSSEDRADSITARSKGPLACECFRGKE